MELILAAIVLALAFAALAYPLYMGTARRTRTSSNALGELTAQRDGIYAMLRDLDQDYQIGKLDEADYHTRREKYLGRAAAVLQQIDGEKSSPQAETQNDEIEKEVAALRQARQEKSASAAGFCRQCGHPYQVGDRFCGKCGQALS